MGNSTFNAKVLEIWSFRSSITHDGSVFDCSGNYLIPRCVRWQCGTSKISISCHARSSILIKKGAIETKPVKVEKDSFVASNPGEMANNVLPPS
jgi:hypothetical protein